MSTQEILIVIDFVSLAVMAVCSVIICYHVESFMQKMASYACIILTFTSIGFLLKAEATSLETLINGQRIVYCFIPHGIFAMVLFILAYCKYDIPKWFLTIGSSINVIISALALTVPYNQWFYKSYWVGEEHGHIVLMKEYAFGHTFAMAVLILYFFVSLGIAVKYTIDNQRKGSAYLWRLIIAVLVPYTAYILPKVIGSDNDMQPVAFAIFLVLVLYMIYKNNLYDVDNILARYSVETTEDAIIVFNAKNQFEGCNKSAEQLFPQLKTVSYDSDIRGEVPAFNDILSGNAKEYQQGNNTYEVKITEIGNKQRVQGKAVWLKDVTLQKNYTDLLQKQKANLESEVVNLSDISYKDQLTGLDNRRRYEEVIDEIRDSSNTKDLIVGLFDVNGLKRVNDTIGHAAGDELIKGAAKIIDSVFGDDGMTFRIGGDEYFVIIRKTDPDISKYVKNLNDAMSTWRGERIKDISIAYGFALGNDNPDLNIDELSIAADRAMYDQKNRYYSQENN